MGQRDAILADIIEFANNDWSLHFKRQDEKFGVSFSQSFDTYEISSAELESIKNTFKAEEVLVRKSYRTIFIDVNGIPAKYFESAFEKIED